MLVGACLLELLVSRSLLLLGSDGTGTGALLRLGHRDDLLERVLGHVLKLRARRVALSHLLGTCLLWEEEELGHVKLQALYVGLEALRAAISAAVVNGNANGLCVLLWDLRLLELVKGEALAKAKLHVVTLCWRVHNRPQQAGSRPREHLGCLGLARVGSTLLASSLVQPGAHEHTVLASGLASIDLAKMHIGDDVVSSVTHGCNPPSAATLPLISVPRLNPESSNGSTRTGGDKHIYQLSCHVMPHT